MKIVEKPELTIVGIEVSAPFEDLWHEVPAAWKALFARHEEIAHLGTTFAEICAEVRESRYREICGALVDQSNPLAAGFRPETQTPAGMTGETFPPARYVHHHHDGPPAEIPETFGRIYDWGTAHGLRLEDFKVDFGRNPAGETPHDLYVRILD